MRKVLELLPLKKKIITNNKKDFNSTDEKDMTF